jgi:ubiquinone/menaquinone biosynthesis C-methylase UbiE
MDQVQQPRPAKVSQPDVATLYDGLARYYDAWAALTESRARKRSLQLAAIVDGISLIEVAVGTGLAFLSAAKQNPNGRNVGIDISKGMLTKAKRRLRKAGIAGAELSIGSALDIQQPDGAFDLLLNSYMFDLLAEDDWAKALSEFHRVLKPGGRLVLVNMTTGERFGSGLYDRLYRLSPRLMGGCRGVRLGPHLVEAGFTVHSRDYVQQTFFPSEVILATKGGAETASGRA